MTKPVPVAEGHCILGEVPLWSTDEQALYWVDVKNPTIHRLDPKTGKRRHWLIETEIGSIGLAGKGRLVAGLRTGFHYVDLKTGAIEPIADPEGSGRFNENRLNDGKVDRAGRFWAGTMDPRDASSALYRLDPGRSVHLMEHGITISNGIGWSPDNRRMFYVDTLHYVIYDYRFDLETGEISNRRVFVRVKPDFGVPDGLTVDAQCGIWVAFYDGWKLVHYLPDGEIDQIIKLPVARPTCPAFGGPDLDELYITTAIDGLPPEQLKDQPMAGDLFMLKPGMKGLPEPKFTG